MVKNINGSPMPRRSFLRTFAGSGFLFTGLAGGAETLRQAASMTKRVLEVSPSSGLSQKELRRHEELGSKQLTQDDRKEYLELDTKLNRGKDFEQFYWKERWQRGAGVIVTGTASQVIAAAGEVLLRD